MGKFEHKAPQRRPGRKLPVIILAVCLVAVVLLAWQMPGIVAKYTQQQNSQALLKAREFYFTSDLLQPGGASYTLNPGTNEIAFQLRNYADGLRYSEVNVSYTVSADGGTLDTASGILSGTGSSSSKTVTLSGLQPGKSYTVTAVGTGGYSQTISATFTVAAEGTGIYKNTLETPTYIQLTVWVENTSGDVVITLPDRLIPDSTDSLLANARNYSDGTYHGGNIHAGSLAEYESHVYRFFKDEGFTMSPISVTVGGRSAEETTLN